MRGCAAVLAELTSSSACSVHTAVGVPHQHYRSPCLACCAFWLQAGLAVLMKDPHVFACHRDRWDTIYYSELGSSLAILQAGYNIDCFMLRYQGVDWRNKASWGCNDR
jgi:hypothetical protein